MHKGQSKQLIVITFLVSTFISACAPFTPHEERATICNELNSQMIFAGNTSNTRAAAIQQAQLPLIQKTYRAHGCDQK